MLIFGLGDRPITMPVIFVQLLQLFSINVLHKPCEGVKNIVIDEQPYSRVLRFDFSEIFSSLSFAFRKIGSAKSIRS